MKNCPCNIQNIFRSKKLKFHWKNFDFINIFTQTIHCGYTLGGSNLYPQCMFLIKNKKMSSIYPYKPQFNTKMWFSMHGRFPDDVSSSFFVHVSLNSHGVS